MPITDGTVQVPSFPGYRGATLHLAIDEAEHQRRQAAGIGPVTGYGFGGLDHLMALPAGLPVPLLRLTPAQRLYVLRAPAGICTVEDDEVTRHAIRPCRVTLATVRFATACKTALESASRFAPFCARRVVIQRRTRWTETLAEFDFYGIGVSLEHSAGGLETLVDPAPWRPMRHTPAGWWFAERAYAAYLAHTAKPAGAAA